jgi:hypothetical protein
MHKMTKQQIEEALDQIPVSSIISNKAQRQLTAKQKRFVREIAINGETKANAYRKAYKTRASPKVVGNNASKLSLQSGIALEIERVKLAVERSAYYAPPQLRALVVDSLAQVLLDDEAKHADKINASRVIGTITGVDLFKEQSQEKQTKHSRMAKDDLLKEIKRLLKRDSPDVVDVEAHSLLSELTGYPGDDVVASEGASPTPLNSVQESQAELHTIPDTRSQNLQSDPPPPNLDDESDSPYTRENPPPMKSSGFHTMGGI